jgi:poly-beta-1,6-N-acetyl-D-glucosamine synthase
VPLSYALVTPARDEVANLRRLAICVLAQTRRPDKWAIVDDGSSDGTLEVARELEANHAWVTVVARPAAGAIADGRRAGRPLLAFRAGVAAVGGDVDVIVKLDADVTMAPDHCERLVAAFAEDPELGMASGTRWELERGAWRLRHVTGTSVEAQCRAYRMPCLEQALPYEPRFCWDGIDEVRANVLGWRTAVLPSLQFRHHRPVGQRDGRRRHAWVMVGRSSHYMGYRPTYLAARSLFHARREPSALLAIWSYAIAALAGTPRHADPGVRAYVRRQQQLRRLPLRAREALGRASRPLPAEPPSA